jgi:hypothetical protein
LKKRLLSLASGRFTFSPIGCLAETPKEAVRLVADGEGDIVYADFVYCDRLDTDTWSVEEVKGDG